MKNRKNPYVSVIVPNYNHEKFLERRLECIFNQTFQDLEVILLDDASSDNGMNILEKYSSHPKVTFFKKNTINSGSPFVQWKKGIELARGEYIWIAESDDFCCVEFLEILLGINRFSDERLGILYCQSLDVNSDGKIISNRLGYTSEFNPNIWEKDFVLEGCEFLKKYLKTKNVIPNASAVLFKKSYVHENFFSDIGDMTICGDWLFWIKLANEAKIGFVARPLNFFREHQAVSRIHSTRKKKLVRLLEEAQIRNYLQIILAVDQTEEWTKLYQKWFSLFPIKSLFKKELYLITSKKNSFFSVASRFISSKIWPG